MPAAFSRASSATNCCGCKKKDGVELRNCSPHRTQKANTVHEVVDGISLENDPHAQINEWAISDNERA